jgi:hypothetical protein
MDGWDDRYLAQCQVLVFTKCLRKGVKVPDGVLRGYCHGTMVVQSEGAGRSTQRVLPWHDGGSEYSEGTANDSRVVMSN